MQSDAVAREVFSRAIRELQRVALRDGLLAIIRKLGDFDLSVAQLATLILLEAEGERSIKTLAGDLGRSVSATSRLVDGLVQRGLVSRQESASDRRSKRLTITDEGGQFLDSAEQRRADAQFALVARLLPDEQAEVARAMRLLAAAAARDHPRSNER